MVPVHQTEKEKFVAMEHENAFNLSICKFVL